MYFGFAFAVVIKLTVDLITSSLSPKLPNQNSDYREVVFYRPV